MLTNTFIQTTLCSKTQKCEGHLEIQGIDFPVISAKALDTDDRNPLQRAR